MNENLNIVNTVITMLDQITIQGARNMSLILDCIRSLDTVRKNLEKETENNVQNQAE